VTEAILELNNLGVRYNKVQALNNIEMNVADGQLVVVVGSNGAGKSTLLRSIAGLQKLAEGSIKFKGEKISGKAVHAVVRKGISLIPEGRMIFGNQTVVENLILGAHWCRSHSSRSAIESDIEKCYERFPILRDRCNQMGGTLSGGEQQMLAISRGLMSSPSLLLIDEPSLGLAPIIIEQVFNTIRSLKKEGLTILLVEQMARLALQIAENGYVLEHGSIVLEGSGAELMENEHIVESYLGRG